jgi:hypothetical protein
VPEAEQDRDGDDDEQGRSVGEVREPGVESEHQAVTFGAVIRTRAAFGSSVAG